MTWSSCFSTTKPLIGAPQGASASSCKLRWLCSGQTTPVHVLTQVSFHLTFNPWSLPLSQHLSHKHIFPPSLLSSLPTPPFIPAIHPSSSLSFLPSIHPPRQPSFCLFTCLPSICPIQLSNFSSVCFILPPFLTISPPILLDIHLSVLPSPFVLPSFQFVLVFPACSLALYLFSLPLSVQVSHLSIFCPPIYLSSLFTLSLILPLLLS